MSDIIKEEGISEDQLLNAVSNLRAMHEDICATEHALIERGRRFMPYEPTFFLYNYFSFNTIFSINWQESIKTGVITEHYKGKESDHINKLIDFCFSEPGFVKSFYPKFIEIITLNHDASQIQIAMNAIVPEGGRITNTEVGTFRTACKKILSNDSEFSERRMKEIISFIYSVRCNIVHGTKTMQHMREEGQRDRIMIYSYLIIALTHMLFMCLEYHSEGYYSESSSSALLSNLRWNNHTSNQQRKRIDSVKPL